MDGINSDRGKTQEIGRKENNPLPSKEDNWITRDIMRRRKRKLRRIKCLAIPVLIILLNVILVIRAVGKIGEYAEVIYEENGLKYMETSENTENSLQKEPGYAKDNTMEGCSDECGMDDYPGYCELSYVEKPKERTGSQIRERLENLSETDERFYTILKNYEEYPREMLESLANNPEMADFVVNYLEKKGTFGGGLNDYEKSQEYPLFLQWDPRWGYISYGDDSVIGLAGCGPASLSMALYYLTGDETITPDRVAAYSMENGYWASGKGTAWALLGDYSAIYDICAEELPMDENIMKWELDQGHILILSMRKGDFTLEGHFIVIYGYDEDGFRVNDPNCVARSRKSWSIEELQGQVNNMWSLYQM